MRFKAQFLEWEVRKASDNPKKLVYTFTKYRILLPKGYENETVFADPYEAYGVKNLDKYTFSREQSKYDKKDRLLYKVTFEDKDHFTYLKINHWNRFLCNIIHDRYYLIKEKEWFFKTLIAAAIGFIFGVIGRNMGYKQGYENGLKEGKAQIQDTARK